MANDLLNQLLSSVQENKKICPVPQKWNELWQLLPERRRVGAGWEPPLPLILAAWAHTSDSEKQELFLSHIRWASDHGALSTVVGFLNSLAPGHWHYSE